MIEIRQAIIIDLEDYQILLECKKRFDKITSEKGCWWKKFGDYVCAMRVLGFLAVHKDKVWSFDFELSEAEAKILDDFIYYLGGKWKNDKNLDLDWLYDREILLMQ